MKRDDLIGMFEMGEIGNVEFTELALEQGMSLEEISEVLARVDEQD